MVIKDKKLSVPKEEYILIILGVLNKFGELSARDIDIKLKDKKSWDGLKISEQDNNIPSYPTVCRILKYLDEEKNFAKWIPKATKEKKYKIKREGKMYLAARKCKGDDYADMLFNPPDCLKCEKESIEQCWKDNFEWLQRLVIKNHLGNSLILENNKKTKIKELFKEPSRLAQVCSYYELHEKIDPFFEKHLSHFTNKIKSICN